MQWSVFGLGGFGQDVNRVTGDEFEKTTRTITGTAVSFEPVTKTFYVPVVDSRGFVDYQTLTITEIERVETPTTRVITEKRKVRRSREVTSIGGFGGAGVDARYFLTRNLGLGLSGEWASGSGDVATLKATITARFPMGANAPYVFAGAGATFGEDAKAIGVMGFGLEHRFTAHAGTFVDAGWVFTGQENAAVFRVGFSFVR